MTTVTITITDNDGSVEMQGTMDNSNAINEPPTPALVVGSYIAANASRIVDESIAWFSGAVNASRADEQIAQPASSIIVPDQGLTQ